MKIQIMVEGHLEQDFLQRICSGMPVNKSIPNGKRVTVGAIAKFVATQVRLARGKVGTFIVIFDREQRTETPEEIREELLQALEVEYKLDTGDIYVFVVDRMIENWIIAAMDEQHTDADSVQSPNSYLKKKLGGYRKRTDGPELLKRGVPSRMAKKSASFRYLYDNIPIKDCWWLNRIDDSN